MAESNQVHDEIVARVTAFMYSPSRFLIEKAHVGSGKTTNTLKTISEMRDIGNWIYLAPFHHVVDENLRDSVFHNYKYIHLKSRAKVCIMPQYRELAERNINIRPICEGHCGAKDTCPYYVTKKELYDNPQNWAGVHHHITEFLGEFLDLWNNKKKMHTYYSAIVVDENPIKVLFINETADADHLGDFRDVLVKLGLDDKEFRKLRRFIDFLIVNYVGGEDINYNKLHRRFNSIDFQAAYDQYQEVLVQALVEKAIRINEIPKDFLNWFSKMQKYETRENIEQMIVKKKATGYTKKHYYFMSYERDALRNLQPKIIALDGTANIEIWEALVGKTASVFNKEYLYSDIYRLTDGEYPLSSWLNNRFELRSTGDRLLRLIRRIYEKKRNKVLVICTKALMSILKEHLDKDKVMFGYYYYLRSRNDFYQVCDTVILACQPNIPEFQVKCFSELSGWNDEIWRKVFTDEEMVQAVGRIRQNMPYVAETARMRENPRQVFIFPYKRKRKYGTYDAFAGQNVEDISYDEMIFFAETGVRPQDIKTHRIAELYKELLTVNNYTEVQFIRYTMKKYLLTHKDSRQILREMEKLEMIEALDEDGTRVNPRLVKTA